MTKVISYHDQAVDFNDKLRELTREWILEHMGVEDEDGDTAFPQIVIKACLSNMVAVGMASAQSQGLTRKGAGAGLLSMLVEELTTYVCEVSGINAEVVEATVDDDEAFTRLKTEIENNAAVRTADKTTSH